MNSSDMPIQLLLVEDNPGDVLLLQRTLGRSEPGEYVLQVAATFGEAQAILAGQSFDAVLLDLSLPDVQGLEVIARLSPLAAGVPILVLTGLADEEVGREAVRAGARDYLVKGRADGAAIGRAIRAAVERRPAAAAPAPENATRPDTSEEVFRLERAVEILDGHYDLFREMTGYFFRDSAHLLADLHAGLRNGDARTIARVAHRIKGTVLYLGADRAAKAAEQVEEIGNSRQLDSAAAAVERLEAEIACLSLALAPHRPDQ
jgi:CheY-like chemotaxis protein/HPt (histidine-containing phosphotransfer) domain-containing protein